MLFLFIYVTCLSLKPPARVFQTQVQSQVHQQAKMKGPTRRSKLQEQRESQRPGKWQLWQLWYSETLDTLHVSTKLPLKRLPLNARTARMKENSPQLPQAKPKLKNSFSVKGIANKPMHIFPTMHLRSGAHSSNSPEYQLKSQDITENRACFLMISVPTKPTHMIEYWEHMHWHTAGTCWHLGAWQHH